MQLKKILVLGLLLISSLGIAQDKEAKFLQFNNFSANFEVPEGKTWVINSIFSSSVGELLKNSDGTQTILPVRIYIKTLNGDIKTDFAGNRFGPQVYQSDNTAATVNYPMTLPGGTKFSLIIVSGNPGDMKMFNGVGYLTLYEVTNNDF